MQYRKSLIIAALLSALSAAPMLALPAAAGEASSPVIVQLVPNLIPAAPDLSDARTKNRADFGNLRPDVLGHIQQLEKSYGFKAKHGFSHVVNGFSADLTQTQIAQLRTNPHVRLVEPDAKVRAVQQSLPWGISSSGANVSPAAMAGDGLTNGVSLSQVRAFVVDTGVALHPDINIGPQVNYVGDGIDGDCNGHGTHVAGTIGAMDNDTAVVGMAPGVQILPLKVLDCSGSGSASNIITAFDYAASTATANPNIKYVLNASIGFPPGTVISTLDTAVQGAVNAGVFVSVAAGNDGTNSCGNTMVDLSNWQSATGVVAVAAIDSTGQEASWSNYGTCVGVWAPGVSVLSTSNSLGTATMSGTSMATPHVTGAAALIRATQPALTPAQVDSRIKSMATALGTPSKDGRSIVSLNVAAVAPMQVSVATVTPSVLTFGTVKAAKSAQVTKAVTIQNTGGASMTVTGFANLPRGVTLAANNCKNVAPSQSCTASFTLDASKKISISASVSTLGAYTNGSFTMTGTVN